MSASSSTATATAVSGATRPTTRVSMLPGPPPPTPSNHQQLPSANAGGTDAALSAFLHRMLLSSPAPSLRSPPSARSQASPSLPPLVSLDALDPRALRNAADTGYFHLAGHGVPPELPPSALAELAQIDVSALRESNLRTLGFSEEEEEDHDADAGGAEDPAVVFDASEGKMDDALPPAAAEYARRMRDVGARLVALLFGCPDVGFREDPFAAGKMNARCLVWASRVSAGETAALPAAGKGKAYPYVVALHCQWEAPGDDAAPAASWVMDDGGEWTAVGSRDGAILVTIGDIAQVWSNGKLRKVRGIARPSKDVRRGDEPDRLSVTVLVTLSLDSVISPLVLCSSDAAAAGDDETETAPGDEDGDEEWRFHSFLLEDYAWRVYHQRLQFKDPLVRYRV